MTNQILGIDNLNQLLDELGGAVVNKCRDEALRKAGAILADEVKRNAPVLTANLMVKIAIRELKSLQNDQIKTLLVGASINGRRISARDIARAAWNERRAMIQSRTDRPAMYAEWLERGHYQGGRKGRGHKKIENFGAPTNGGRKFIKPRPFLKPSFARVIGQVPQIFIDEFQKQIAAARVIK